MLKLKRYISIKESGTVDTSRERIDFFVVSEDIRLKKDTRYTRCFDCTY